ncbi:MAG TPA: hypothetical protein VKB76_19685, partial [Ktedonobacterales bacterium]|nr:hypothetical protein [Ktedonobacterales bacterium]
PLALRRTLWVAVIRWIDLPSREQAWGDVSGSLVWCVAYVATNFLMMMCVSDAYLATGDFAAYAVRTLISHGVPVRSVAMCALPWFSAPGRFPRLTRPNSIKLCTR